MPTVTSIEPQKNNKRVNIYLDGKFGFGLDLENLVKFNLRVNKELTTEEVSQINKKAEFQKTFDKLLKFAMLRPRSEKEIKDYFKRKKVHETLHNELFDRLKRLELLNDEKFARWWVEQRMQFKSKSKKELIYELRIKGIGSETIKNIFEDIDISDDKAARKLVEKRMFRWERYDDKTKKQKITQYLAGKGFDWQVISDVLKYFVRS